MREKSPSLFLGKRIKQTSDALDVLADRLDLSVLIFLLNYPFETRFSKWTINQTHKIISKMIRLHKRLKKLSTCGDASNDTMLCCFFSPPPPQRIRVADVKQMLHISCTRLSF